MGFEHVVFEDTGFVAEKIPGGTGGMDPTYQILESLLGINFSSLPETVQQNQHII